MHLFYIFWFFFCAGWGYGLATFPAYAAPSPAVMLLTFPSAVLGFFVLFAYELRRLPDGKLAAPPSLSLKPWNRPTGLEMFVSLTFTFSALWGIGIAQAFGYSGLYYSLHSLALGTGGFVATYICHRAFPSKFAA